MTVANEVGMGELGRTVQRIEGTLNGLDSKVDNWREELIDLRHKTEANEKAIAEIRAAQSSEKTKNETRRWGIYLAVFVAALAFISQLYFAQVGPP